MDEKRRELITVLMNTTGTNFSFAAIEKKFGPCNAYDIARLVKNAINFSMNDFRDYSVCIDDLPTNILSEIIRLIMKIRNTYAQN